MDSNFLLVIISFLLGFLINYFLKPYLSRKGENLATKEDIAKITIEIESVKNIFKNEYDISKSEKEFYNQTIENLCDFFASLKRYQQQNNIVTATKPMVLADTELKEKYFKFIDSMNIFVQRSYVFLNEENYSRLKNALDTSTDFADLGNNLLDAMRKSIHPNTKLTTQGGDFKEFHY